MAEPAHILICDDDPVVHESLGIYLKSEGFAYSSAMNGHEALKMAETQNPDLMVLDLMMPGVGGIDVCRTIRKDRALPIIMLTAKGEELDRILGLELGADDYIVKPFSPREVVARIKAVLRRTKNRQDSGDGTLRFDGLAVNIAQYRVEIEGESVAFTPKEVEILHLLASHPGQVYTREQILEQVWGYTYFGDTRTVDTHIKRIRAKLPEKKQWTLKTIYGVGYKFEAAL